MRLTIGLIVLFAVLRPLSCLAEPPNILIIMTDDQGAGDLGVSGNPVVETPNIDALARASVRFRRFYVSPVCTPTRAALMTGRSAPRTRAIDTYRGRAMMDPSEITIAEILQSHGYATGLFGKWHLGDAYPMRPMDQGFERVLMHRAGGLGQPADSIDNNRRYTDAILLRNGREVETTGYCMDVYVDEAIDFMTTSVKSERPFFTYVATNTPHGPFHDVPSESYEKYRTRDLSRVMHDNHRPDNIARIFAMVDNIDMNVGRLLEAIDELGVRDDTIVIYLHDNGPNSNRYVGAMRGTKSMVHEGGIRTPCFIRWPRRFEAGLVRDEIAAHVDVLPTLVDAVGLTTPTDVVLDGRSLMPLLEDNGDRWAPRRLCIQAHRGDRRVARHHFAVVSRRFKLLRASGFGRETPAPDHPFELYDLASDPYERNNLAEDMPELVADLLATHDAWFAAVTDGEGHGTPPRIIVGTDVEPNTVLNRNDWRPLDSHGYGRAGTWWVDVAGQVNSVAFEADVLFRQPVDSPTVVLSTGPEQWEMTHDGATRRVTFGRIELPAGPCDLTLTAFSDGKAIAPEHLILRSLEPVSPAGRFRGDAE